ncbi:MAG: hypothetical protein IPJ74_23380 [Saprospiraceae bacterium]|nr:hypothetical protein [Saprospiraceae bacterium]
MEGDIDLNNVKIAYNQQDTFYINSIKANSLFTNNGDKEFRLNSDIADVTISGIFDIEQIPDLITSYFDRNYTALSTRLGIKSKNKTLNPSNYNYNILIKDSKGLNKILDERLGDIKDLSVIGYYNSSNDSLLVKTDISAFTFGNILIEDVAFDFNSLRDQGWVSIQINNTTINEKLHLDPITFISYLNRDTLDFGLNYYSGGFLDNLNLEGKFYPLDSNLFQIQFEQSNLVILEMPWEIDASNFITFGKDYIEAKNFTLKSQEKRIVLETTQNKGLKLQISDVGFDFINELWQYEPLNFDGNFNVTAEVGNIFEMSNLSADIIADSFLINNDPYGRLHLTAKAGDLKSMLAAELLIDDGISSLSAKGNYNLAEIAETISNKPAAERASGYFDFDIDIKSYPLCMAEYFIGDVISNTDGRFDGKLKINGLPKLPNINGDLSLLDGSKYLHQRNGWR